MFEIRLSRLFLLVVVAAAGIAAFAMRGQTSPPAPQVALQTLQTGEAGGVTASGILKPALLVSVGTQLSGQVVEILADFNDPVKKDQPVARLARDTFEAAAREARAALAVAMATARTRQTAIARATSELEAARSELARLEAQLAGARAEYARARRDHERKRLLAKRGNVPVRELDDARTAEAVAVAALAEAEADREARKAAVATAEVEISMAKADHAVAQAVVIQRNAALEYAEIELAQTTIRAPIDGVVLSRSIEAGQIVTASPNVPVLFTVAHDLRRMVVHASVDESDIGRIHVGRAARFTVDAYPDRTFHGTVRQIRKAPQVIQNVVTYTVVIETGNDDGNLLPGMTALVDIASANAPKRRPAG